MKLIALYTCFVALVIGVVRCKTTTTPLPAISVPHDLPCYDGTQGPGESVMFCSTSPKVPPGATINVPKTKFETACGPGLQHFPGGSTGYCVPAGSLDPMPTHCPVINGKKFCSWLPSHVAFIDGHLNGDMLGAELGDICPKGKANALVDYTKVWQALFKCTAQAESGFDPENGFTESFTDGATKVAALSVGLMQLSVGDKLNYHTPYCSKLTPITLKDPETNLGCAAEIMAALINRKPGALRTRLGAYWSTIRDDKIHSCMVQEFPRCFNVN